MVAKKKAAKRRFSRFHDPRDKQVYRRLQDGVRQMLHSKSEDKWNDTLNNVNDDPGSFWKLLKRLKSRADSNSPLRIRNRTLLLDAEKTEASADFIANQFTISAPVIPKIERQVQLSLEAIPDLDHGKVDDLAYFEALIRSSLAPTKKLHTVAVLLDVAKAYDQVWKPVFCTSWFSSNSLAG